MAYNPINLGPTTTANSQAVVLPSDQVAIPITDNGGSLTVDGSVSVSNFPATQPVSGTVTANAGTGTMTVTVISGATGGDTTFYLVSAATTNATNLKASAGKVTGWYIYNSNASARKVAFHNTAGTPTAGSSVFYSIVIPGLAATNVSFPNGIDFSTGIAITTVTGLTNTDATAVGLNDLIINIFYK